MITDEQLDFMAKTMSKFCLLCSFKANEFGRLCINDEKCPFKDDNTLLNFSTKKEPCKYTKAANWRVFLMENMVTKNDEENRNEIKLLQQQNIKFSEMIDKLEREVKIILS